MSKYFQVLERLERGRDKTAASRALDVLVPRDGIERGGVRPGPRPARSAPAKPVVEPGTRPEAQEVAPPPQSPPTTAIAEVRARPASKVEPLRFPPSAALRGVDRVFQNIEALSMGRRPMTLVFAGASATESVHALTRSLTEHAEGKGERVLVAELCDAGGERMLVCRHPAGIAGSADEGSRAPLPIDLHDGVDREALVRWREQVGPATDIMLLIGPPLVDSVDSALLASSCDGLVVVAVHEETHRAALTVASERARLTKCPTLAVVVNNNRDTAPSWLRRIVE